MLNDKTLELKRLYAANRQEIRLREAKFKRFLDESSEKRTFEELAFCLLTPQSKALNCWAAVGGMSSNSVLFKGDAGEISEYIACARFKNKKALYIVKAREIFSRGGRVMIKEKIRSFKNPSSAREWLTGNIKGMGYKEASHFLRNIGMNRGLAILDRHILKNLCELGVIDSASGNLSKSSYIEIEDKMKTFARTSGIPLNHLDLLLWFKETGTFFK